MTLKEQLKNLSDHELSCIRSSVKRFLMKNDEKEYSGLKNLLLLIEIEIDSRISDSDRD